MILHHVDRGAEVRHALTKLALNAAAFLLPHLVQSLERFADGCHHCRLQSSIDSAACGIQCAGNAKDDVEIGFGGNTELASGRAKSRNVGAHQRTIQSQGFAATSLQAKRDFNMATRDLFFQQAPQLHLDGVGTRRQTKMQVEKSVVNGFQRKRESDTAIAWRGRKLRCSRTRDSVRLIYQFAFYLRETRHGAKRHKWFPNPD